MKTLWEISGKTLNIPTYIYSENIEEDAKKVKESVETYARKRRYILMNNILEEKIEGKNILEKRFSGGIITAHNANDNAETIFMNMLRGSREKTDLRELKIIQK